MCYRRAPQVHPAIKTKLKLLSDNTLAANIDWRRGDSKPKSPFTEDTQQPYSNDTKLSQVQTDTDLTNQVTEQIITDSIQNHNTTLHKKYAICMHQNNITPESLPADLIQIITVWPDLPENIKTEVKTLVEIQP